MEPRKWKLMFNIVRTIQIATPKIIILTRHPVALRTSLIANTIMAIAIITDKNGLIITPLSEG